MAYMSLTNVGCLLQAISHSNGVDFHAYEDDSQLYVHCNRCDSASTAARLELCITDVIVGVVTEVAIGGIIVAPVAPGSSSSSSCR